MIPLMIDCTNRQVVIFGGGSVGARKATFFAGEAEVIVYSRTFSDAFNDIPVRKECTILQSLNETDIIGIIRDVFLVITATSDTALNSRIMKLCRKMEILVNNADGEEGDVIIPSRITGREYTLAISTGGSSPAVSRFIRERLQEYLHEELSYIDSMIQLQKRLRRLLKSTIPSQDIRSQIIWQALCDTDVQKMLCVDEEAAFLLVKRRYIV